MKKRSPFSTTLETKYYDLNLWNNIQKLDLQLIIDRMLVKHEWSLERTQQSIIEYRRYLYMTQKFDSSISPTKDVDMIWHEHILHTNKYAIDCNKLFGRFLHHLPTPSLFENNLKIESSDANANCDGGTTNCGNGQPFDCSNKTIDFDKPVKKEKASIGFQTLNKKFFAN